MDNTDKAVLSIPEIAKLVGIPVEIVSILNS